MIVFLILLISCSIYFGTQSNASNINDVSNGSLKDSQKKVKSESIPSVVGIKAISEEDLIGFCFQPHFAEDNIKFLRDKTFIFNRYNETLNKTERLTGAYKIETNTITLYYSDRAKEVFKTFIEKHDGFWRIENKTSHLIKGEDGYEN